MHKVSDNILRRIYLLFAAFLLFGIVVVAQVLRIQFGQQRRWQQTQVENRVYYKHVLADRGSILSDDGSVLAITLPYYRLAMDVTVLSQRQLPHLADSLDLLCRKLAAYYGQGELSAHYFKTKLLKAIQQKDRHIYLLPVGQLLGFQQMKLATTLPLLRRGRFKGGLIIEKVNHKRFYPFKDLARITLGLLQDDTTAVKGIEWSFNRALRGKDGLMLVQRIPGNVEVPLSEFGEVEAKDGLDVETTINLHMQDVVASALRRGVKLNHAKGGVAILMEVATGQIKAIANYPEDYNHAISTQYEPGSTFKLASVIAALEEGVIHPSDTIATGNGTATYYDRTLKEAGSISYGRISLQQAFEKSSNVAVSKVIYNHYRSKPQRFYEQLEQMGAVTSTEFQLKGEPMPYLIRPGDRQWSGITLPWLSIGYNVRLTPLQQLTLYNAVANGGKMVQPMIVKAIKSNSQTVAQFDTKVLRERICSDATLATVQRLLEGVVQHGTATNIATPLYKIAGKTGTCQKLVGHEYKKVYRASFAGYFPADRPKYSCFVLMDEPSGGEYYGAKVAAPVFKEIADNLYATDMSLRDVLTPVASEPGNATLPVTHAVNLEDAKTVYHTLNVTTPSLQPVEYVHAWQAGGNVALSPIKIRPGSVPDVLGMNAKDALVLLENSGMQVRLVGSGRVSSQSVMPGTHLRQGEFIYLNLH